LREKYNYTQKNYQPIYNRSKDEFFINKDKNMLRITLIAQENGFSFNHEKVLLEQLK
jgi:hypothetical protein